MIDNYITTETWCEQRLGCYFGIPLGRCDCSTIPLRPMYDRLLVPTTPWPFRWDTFRRLRCCLRSSEESIDSESSITRGCRPLLPPQLQSIFEDHDSFSCQSATVSSHLSSKPAWHFLGDSQMGTIMTRLLYEYQYKVLKKKVTREECGFLDYCQLEKCSKWIPLSENKRQRPFEFELEHLFCSDLSWYKNTKVRFFNAGNIFSSLFDLTSSSFCLPISFWNGFVVFAIVNCI